MRCARQASSRRRRLPSGRGISPACSRPPAFRASALSTRTSSRRRPSGTKRSASCLASIESRRRCPSLRRFRRCERSAPIQVLGLLESAGVEFDHLWVTGLTDEAWPLKSSPNPFLPLAQQRKAGIPEASAETSLALDRRITDGWKQAAGEVVFSHFTKEEDRDVLPSPLIADLPEKAVEIPAFSKLRDVIFASRKTETLQDRVAPAVREKQVRGGTRVLSDQAACPFRAFARHRLHAEELEEPAEGLDASKRGKLVHLLMQNVWDELKDSTALQGDL